MDMEQNVKKNKIHDALINYYIEASDDVIKEEINESIPDKQEYDAKKEKLLKKIQETQKHTL